MMGKPDPRASQQLVDWICSRRLTLPALALLEVVRPFGFIASQGLLLCQPLLSYLVDDSQIAGYVDLLTDRESLEDLRTQLDARSQRSEEKA